MKNVIRFGLLIVLVLTSLSFLYAVESPGTVDFSIRFYDRRVYYVESDPIFVQITITNNSPAPYRFKLADDRAFSVDFDIRTMSNRPLQQADSLIKKRTVNSQVFFREVAIESGESFSFVENICDYISFGQTGSFRVKAKIYPELFRSAGASSVIESNYLSMTLRPAIIKGPDGIPIEMDVATGAVLVKQKLPPDEVVAYMITARQESQWEKFFLYLDLEAMLRKDALQGRKFNAENEEGRRRMLNAYKQNLQSAVIDGDIVTIPNSFNIMKTQYNNDTGSVVVLQRYRYPNYTELREYTYWLEKKDNFWVIVNYSVQGMGTIGNN
jgi:hypothetical protein